MSSEHQPTMSGPATYRIRVQGRLNAAASNSLCGLSIRSAAQDDRSVETTLEGVLPDQAALAGILAAIYARQLPVISVKFLDPRNSSWESLPERGHVDSEDQ